ncbi:hypothetical protein CJ030_MR3G014729 [Morella rubra]|uniref:DC1 domain-containing protein n=1 Tax=Morella rubra TaxID=262757 RepID=A0A6A1VY44_9ROSI|nr:hypothetical protein CJ030_MR3G014729 [Morella rubra]
MPRITEIQHSSHPHQLISTRAETPYHCYGCQELGFDPCYQCNERQCNFHLHEECAAANHTSTNHPFITGGRFVLSSEELQLIFCKVLNGRGALGLVLRVGRASKGTAPSKCLKCQRKKASDNIVGWAYVSTCGNYCYHVKCVKELILEKWREFYFRVPSNDQEIKIPYIW